MNQKKRAGYFKLVLVVFLLIYLSIGLINQYTFRTNAFDYGNYNQILYKLAHFESPRTTISGDVLFWADHFEPILMLIIPFNWIFGVYGLIILQSVFLCFGALGIFRFLELLEKDNWTPFLFATTFLLSFSVLGAVESEYHSSIIGICLIPWLFWSLKSQKTTLYWLILLGILSCRENLGIVLIITTFPMLFESIWKKDEKVLLFGATILGLIYFFLVTQVVMPKLDSSKLSSFQHLDSYTNLGWKNISGLFINTTGNSSFNGVKVEFVFFSLFAGWILTVGRPIWFLAYIPLLLEKFLHQDAIKWGVNSHYSIEGLLVILFGGYFSYRYLVPRINQFRFIPGTILVLNVLVTIRFMDDTLAYIDKGKLRFYQFQHYTRDFNVYQLHSELQPYESKQDGLSAQSNLVPYLSQRTNIRLFPDTTQVRYILLNPSEKSSYPLAPMEMKNRINAILASGKFRKIQESEVLMVLEKN
ncbi:MAG: DUF2079 domain-containing protein [Bacteroidia bacterium]|nr:DUF2079 domain-containing protein [Bacteroidia bacterium]